MASVSLTLKVICLSSLRPRFRCIRLALELPDMDKCIVVHIQSRPRNLRAVRGDQHLLRAVAANIPNKNVLSPACITVIANIGCPVAGPIADERHHGIDEAGADYLASLAGRVHRIAFLIKELKTAIGRPYVVIV